MYLFVLPLPLKPVISTIHCNSISLLIFLTVHKAMTMIKSILITALLFLAIGVSAQQADINTVPVVAKELKATKMGDNFLLTWKSDKKDNAGYWEVQGSEDGSNFKMLGLVMGADPSTNGSDFKFRQNHKKLIPGLKFYRVVLVENESAAIASNMIGLTK